MACSTVGVLWIMFAGSFALRASGHERHAGSTHVRLTGSTDVTHARSPHSEEEGDGGGTSAISRSMGVNHRINGGVNHRINGGVTHRINGGVNGGGEAAAAVLLEADRRLRAVALARKRRVLFASERARRTAGLETKGGRVLRLRVCMYVCRHVCMYACMYVCMHACMYVCVYVCMCVCMHGCMHACVYVCMCVCMHVWMYACMHACRYVCMCVCVYGCMS